MTKLMIFPSSYYGLSIVDEDLQKEHEAVNETGLFQTILFGYDKWFHEGRLVLSERVPEPIQAIYRGWMMRPEQYTAFYEALKGQNITLVTSPEAYHRMHAFPNVYRAFGTDTAKMMIFPLHEQIDVALVKANFERFMVKDFVKSVKGTSFPAFFTRNVTQAEFDDWMQVFYQYRGELLTGGICIKEYLTLRKYSGKTNEYRVFYANGQVLSVCRNSGQPSNTPEVPRELIEKYRFLDSPYYTIDFAELENGEWKILEAGDGSVSGLSDGQDASAYFRALYKCFCSIPTSTVR